MMKRDRFVALDASFDGGEIVTKRLKLEGQKLQLNAKADFGEIVVELLGADDKVLATSKPVQRDGLDISVEWDDAPPLAHDDPVSLRINLKNARLFALWCH